MARLGAIVDDPFAESPAPAGKQKGGNEAARFQFADAASAALGVPRDAVLAHIALETKRDGSATVGQYNFGNIKGKGPAGSASVDAKEYTADGKPYTEKAASFRSYSDPVQAGTDYAETIKRRFPEAVGAQDARQFAQGLKSGGYATDPRFVDKIVGVAGSQKSSGPKLGAIVDDPFGDASAPVKAGPSKAYQAGRNEAGGATRGLVNVLQGPTFGFADELGGAAGALIDTVKGKGGTFSEKYRANRDYLRGASDQASQDNPILSAVTQGMASAPAMLFNPAAGVAKGAAGLGGNALRAGITGGITGALGGAGASKAETVGGVAQDAAISAATGGALGAAAVPVQNALGAVAGNVRQRVSESAAMDAAKSKIAEALSRDARGTDFRVGGQNPVDQAVSRINKLGPEARVVDASGQNTRQLLDTLATLPGRTKDDVERAIRSRQSGRDTRLIAAADDALGTGGARLSSTVDALVTQRKEAAAPLYKQLESMAVAAPSKELVSAVRAADDLGATALGRKMATAERQSYTLDLDAPQNWQIKDLDRLKQGLDTLIEGQIGNTGKMSPLGTKLTGLKNALVSEIDTHTIDPQTGQSVYKAARDAYSGPSAIMTAAEEGRKVWSQDGSTIKAAMSGLPPGEAEGFRVGAMEALRAKLGRQSGQTEIMKMWQEKATREKLQEIFGDLRSYREFASAVASESRLKGLEGVGRGSQTAARQFAAGDLDTEALGELAKAGAAAKTGNLLGLASSAKGAWNRVSTPETTRDAMGNLLLSGGAEGRKNLESLAELTKRINDAKARNATRAGLASGVAVNALMPR